MELTNIWNSPKVDLCFFLTVICDMTALIGVSYKEMEAIKIQI